NTFYMSNGAVFNNQAGATFTAQNDATISPAPGAAAAFNNAGTFIKKTTTGTTVVSIPFNNTEGTLDALAGTIALAAGGVDSGGPYEAASGAIANLGPNRPMTGTYSGSGAGIVTASGPLNIGTGGATFNFAGSLLQLGGVTINLGANTMTIGSSGTLT